MYIHTYTNLDAYILSFHHLNECADYDTKEGARGVMVIVVGNGHGDTSSNPGPE